MMSVSTQIAVRLPDDLVAWIDEQVSAGAGSRASVTTKALRRYRRQVLAEEDAARYREGGGYPELSGWSDSASGHPIVD